MSGVPAVEVLDARADNDQSPTNPYTTELVWGVVEHASRIDDLLATYAQGWTLDRMPAVDRNVLRIGVYELLHEPEVPTKVAINEAIELAKRYSKPIEDLIGQSERLTRLDTTGTEMAPTRIVEMAQLGEAQERMRVALDSFARYVPDDVVRELLKNGEAAVIGGKSLSISILFTDIKGFSSLSEKLSPMELTHHMAEYFDAMIGIMRQHHGTVDKLIGELIYEEDMAGEKHFKISNVDRNEVIRDLFHEVAITDESIQGITQKT